MCRILSLVFVIAVGYSELAAHEPPKAPPKRSRDVNVPPPLPSLGRQVADRVGFEDPTTEYGNAVVTGPRVKATFSAAPFFKVGVPDPFELAEQIKPIIPHAVEPGLTPVLVNPRRVK